MYHLQQQLMQGRKVEAYLDTLFTGKFHIQKATRRQERMGIDRIFTRKDDGRVITIQYKADWTASHTGNAFVETVSVDRGNIPGWAYTCQATYILYYIVNDGLIYVLKPSTIKKHVDEWKEIYEERSVPNDGYHTKGLLVPLDVFEELSIQVINT